MRRKTPDAVMDQRRMQTGEQAWTQSNVDHLENFASSLDHFKTFANSLDHLTNYFNANLLAL